MWRHNADGEFNVGYGGQQRRWVINEETLVCVSRKLKIASIKCNDFEEVIDACRQDDFIFVDPPYCPGQRDMVHDHFTYGKFTFNDHQRLAITLEKASARRIRWALTTSGHPDIVSLFHGYDILAIPRGTGRRIGTLTNDSCEVLIRNYKEVSQ
jgi:DNA adenine methylase